MLDCNLAVPITDTAQETESFTKTESRQWTLSGFLCFKETPVEEYKIGQQSALTYLLLFHSHLVFTYSGIKWN